MSEIRDRLAALLPPMSQSFCMDGLPEDFAALADRLAQADAAKARSDRADGLALILADLDRCEHGRHESDPCFGCPSGVSTGNPRFPEGAVIGTSLHATYEYVVPPRGSRYDPRAWRHDHACPNPDGDPDD